MRIRVENHYTDGFGSEKFYDDVPEFLGDPTDEDALKEHLRSYTGDGHGATPGVDGMYWITILDAQNRQLIDEEIEFG